MYFLYGDWAEEDASVAGGDILSAQSHGVVIGFELNACEDVFAEFGFGEVAYDVFAIVAVEYVYREIEVAYSAFVIYGFAHVLAVALVVAHSIAEKPTEVEHGCAFNAEVIECEPQFKR